MDKTPDSLMAAIRGLFDSCEPLGKQAMANFMEAGRGLATAKQIFDRGEEPPDHLAGEIREALARGRACQKRILDIMCQVVPLLEELSAITSKKHYAKCLTEIGMTPREFHKMQRLRDQWDTFEQAVTWDEDRVEHGAVHLVGELTLDDALKLIRIFERKRDSPLDPREMTQDGRLKAVMEGHVRISMSNREQTTSVLKLGRTIAELRRRAPDDWQRIVRENFDDEELANRALLFHDNWPRIQPLLEAEAARAVAAGHTLYHHPTIKQALRMVGALPPLENGGIARLPPSDLAFLDDIAAQTGVPKVDLSWSLALCQVKDLDQVVAHAQEANLDIEDYLISRGLLRVAE